MLSRAMTPSKYMWTVVIIAVFAGFTIVDLTMVNLAVASLMKEFEATTSHTTWVLTGNLLALGVAVPSCGYLADRFGMKRIFLASLALFTLASIGCIASQSLNMLIAFHVISGFGIGSILVLTRAIVWRVAPHEERGKFLGIMYGPILIMMAMGPVISGALVEYASWRWIFVVDVPLGVVAFVLALVWLREQKIPTTARFDLPGIALVGVGFALMLYAFSDAPVRTWDDTRIIVCIIAGAACVVGFVARELRIRDPIMDLRLFANRGFAVGNLVLWSSVLCGYGFNFLTPLFLQNIRGHGALETGLIMIPMGVAGAIAFPIAGRIYDAYGARWLATTAFFAAAGVTALNALLWQADTAVWVFALTLFLLGLATSTISLASPTAAMNEVKAREIPRAVALLSGGHQLITSLAIGLLATFLTQRSPVLIERGVRGLVPGSPEFFAAAREAGLFTFHETFLIVSTFTALVVFLTLLLRSGRPTVPSAEVGLRDWETGLAAEPGAIEP